MIQTNSRRYDFAVKAGKVMLAGVLAVSLLPASAFAATAGDKDSQGKDAGLTLASTQYTAQDGSTYTIWPDGYWDKRDEESGTYVWKTIIKGDGSHYGHYDAKITFTVEDDVLTAVDLTSEGTTYGGIWGTVAKTSTIVGYLPTGVADATTVETVTDEDEGTATTYEVTPSLSGTDAYDTEGNGGYAISAIYLYQVDSEGNLVYELDEDGEIVYEEVEDDDGDVEEQAVTVSKSLSAGRSGGISDYSDDDIAYVSSTGMLTVTNTDYNLVQVNYKIGDFFVFSQYTALDDDAGMYEEADTDFKAEPTGIGAKNRDQYSLAAYSVMIQRELAAFMNEEKDDVEIVSSATKTSDAVAESIYSALGYYYPLSNKSEYETLLPSESEYGAIFSSVADDLEITIDKGKSTETDARDTTSVTKNDDDQYVLTSRLSEGLSIGSIAFYDFGDETLDSQELFDLGSDNDSTLYKALNGTDVSDTGYVSGVVTSTSAGHGVKGALTADEVADSDLDAEWDEDTKTLTIGDTQVTHVVIGYSIAKSSTSGYGTVGVAYSLADLAKAAEVTELIENLDTTDAEAVAAAKAAYDALSTDAKAFVDATAISALNDAVASLKAEQTVTVGNASKNLTYKNAAQTFKLSASAKTGVTFTKESGSDALSVAEDGTVTVKKGATAGVYTMTVKATAAETSEYASASTTQAVTVKVSAASQTIAVKNTSKAYKASKLKKAKKTFKLGATASGGGALTYQKVSGSKKIKVNAKTGKVTVKKGTKKGTYKAKVKVTAKQVTGKYTAKTVTKTIKVKVK